MLTIFLILGNFLLGGGISSIPYAKCSVGYACSSSGLRVGNSTDAQKCANMCYSISTDHKYFDLDKSQNGCFCSSTCSLLESTSVSSYVIREKSCRAIYVTSAPAVAPTAMPTNLPTPVPTIQPTKIPLSSSDCPNNYKFVQHFNLCYYYHGPKLKLNVKRAKKFCKNHDGGVLFAVSTLERQAFLSGLFSGTDTTLWIGLNMLHNPPTWFNGDKYEYSNWWGHTRRPDSPVHSSVAASYQYDGHGRWIDFYFDDEQYQNNFICEWIPPPLRQELISSNNDDADWKVEDDHIDTVPPDDDDYQRSRLSQGWFLLFQALGLLMSILLVIFFFRWVKSGQAVLLLRRFFRPPSLSQSTRINSTDTDTEGIAPVIAIPVPEEEEEEGEVLQETVGGFFASLRGRLTPQPTTTTRIDSTGTITRSNRSRSGGLDYLRVPTWGDDDDEAASGRSSASHSSHSRSRRAVREEFHQSALPSQAPPVVSALFVIEAREATSTAVSPPPPSPVSIEMTAIRASYRSDRENSTNSESDGNSHNQYHHKDNAAASHDATSHQDSPIYFV